MCLEIKPTLPQPSEFVNLRQDVSWGAITVEQAKIALAHSICGVTLYNSDKTIGMARVIGDGVLNVYIQDVIIAKAYRKKGYGDKILTNLITLLKEKLPCDCSVGLMAAKGQTKFYERFGFLVRPSETTDSGMMNKLSKLKSPSQ